MKNWRRERESLVLVNICRGEIFDFDESFVFRAAYVLPLPPLPSWQPPSPVCRMWEALSRRFAEIMVPCCHEMPLATPTGIWCTVLTFIGYFIGENQELIMAYSHYAIFAVLLLSALIVMVYVWLQRRNRVKAGE